MKKYGITAIALWGAGLYGCASPYEEYYTPAPTVIANALPQAACEAPLEITHSENLDEGMKEMWRQGYTPIGHAAFNGTAESLNSDEILNQAKALSACKVLLTVNYTGTESGVNTIVLPDNKTSHTFSTASAFGTGGYADAIGSSTTTTYGTKTIERPYSVERYDRTAVFLKKVTPRIGIMTSDVPPDISRQIGKNGGVVVQAVMRGSPAYRADFFEGDVILSFAGQPLNSSENSKLYSDLANSHLGQTVQVQIWRQGEVMEKSLTVGF